MIELSNKISSLISLKEKKCCDRPRLIKGKLKSKLFPASASAKPAKECAKFPYKWRFRIHLFRWFKVSPADVWKLIDVLQGGPGRRNIHSQAISPILIKYFPRDDISKCHTSTPNTARSQFSLPLSFSLVLFWNCFNISGVRISEMSKILEICFVPKVLLFNYR